MAINKVVNKSTKSHGAMRNVLRYVLSDEKIKEGYVEIEGPYTGEDINYNKVYRDWLDEKKLWDKDSGRMYSHNIISFHKDEQVTPDQVLSIGKDFSKKFFSGYQYVIGVHQDKEHLHCHIVTNTVSYIDGKKFHQTQRDLKHQKDFTNQLCIQRGLSVTEKGHHFDGTVIEQGEISAWSKDKYNLLINSSKKSFVADCAIAIMEVTPEATSREEFISGMLERGWSVQWKDSRKHIVFENEDGKKVRDTNIEKTFSGMEVNKEALLHEFKRQNELRLTKLEEDRERVDAELKRYYTELETVASGLHIAETVRNDSETITRDGKSYECNRRYEIPNTEDGFRTQFSEGEWERAGLRSDTEAFIRKLDSKEKASGEKRDGCIAERKDRDAEQSRLGSERKREVSSVQQRITEKGTDHERRSISRGFSL